MRSLDDSEIAAVAGGANNSTWSCTVSSSKTATITTCVNTKTGYRYSTASFK